MARVFNISAIFSAVNRMSAPVGAIVRSLVSLTRTILSTSAAGSRIFAGLHYVLTRTGSALNGLRAKFNFANALSNVRQLTGGILKLGSALKGIVMPGWGSLLAGGGLAYGGKELIDNSSAYEQRYTRTQGLLMSIPAFGLDENAAQKKAKEIMRATQKFADTQVGEFPDWAEFATQNIARGIIPNERWMAAAGSLAAVHKGGMPGFIETLMSGARGETAALDQIPGLQARTRKGEVTLYMNGESFNIGNKTDKDYYKRYITALTQIAEKNFSKVGELQGRTFDAIFSTLKSTISVMFDDAFRGETDWFEYIKSAVKAIDDTFKRISPRMTELFDNAFNALQGNTGILDAIGNSIEGVFNIIITELSKLFGLAAGSEGSFSPLIDFINNIPSYFQNIIDTIKGLDWDEIVSTAKEFGAAISNVASIINSTASPGFEALIKVLKAVGFALQICVGAVEIFISEMTSLFQGIGSVVSGIGGIASKAYDLITGANAAMPAQVYPKQYNPDTHKYEPMPTPNTNNRSPVVNPGAKPTILPPTPNPYQKTSATTDINVHINDNRTAMVSTQTKSSPNNVINVRNTGKSTRTTTA